MGSSKAQTVGFWYPYDLQFGLAYAMDALLEVRGGDATAWAGRITTNATVQVNAPNLWGGEDGGGEGGIVGPMDVLFGDDDQQPHPFLQQQFSQESALRGKVSLLFRNTRYGAYNPYPKSLSAKGERIFAAWPGGEPWYPETADLPIASNTDAPPSWLGGGFSVHYIGPRVHVTGPIDGFNEFTRAMADQYGLAYEPVGPQTEHLYFWRPNESGLIYSKREENTEQNQPAVQRLIDRGWQPNETALIRFWVLTGLHMCVYTLGASSDPPPAPDGYSWSEGSSSPMSTSAGTVRLWQASAFLRRTSGLVPAMNPAHLLYYSKVSPTMEGLPAATLDDDHWRAQADRLFNEGFGLCTDWIPGAESVESLQQRICNIIGGALVKSRRDGKWRLNLARGVDDIESLPVLTDADILEWQEEPSILEDAVNQLQTKWFDPQEKLERITPAEHALASIDAFGGVISQTMNHPEIPTESLALRVNSRNLHERSTPLRRISPVCGRRVAHWESFTYFRLQAPKRGIADMVMLLLRIEVGETPSSAVKMVAVQDIYRMPLTTYVQPQEPVDYSPPQIPLPAENQRLFEIPYVDLAATLPHAELAALPPEIGYVAAAVERPGVGINYVLLSGATGEDLQAAGARDWCPTAVVPEGCEDRLQEVFEISAGSRLELVELGTAVLWDEEICRLDALDLELGTVQLGRGCADTTPALHDAGSRLFFYGEWAGSDGREYGDGETVNAKALTRTSSAQLEPDAAPAMSLLMGGRHARPYPPARLRINGEAYPNEVEGAVLVSWAHRDRLIQQDQLIDTQMESIGPEPGVTAAIEVYNDLTDELIHAEGDIDGDEVDVPSSGLSPRTRIELFTVRDGLESWQRQIARFTYGAAISGPELGGVNFETYVAKFSIDSPTLPVKWSVRAGTLPPGVHMVQDGSGELTLQGVPDAPVGYYEATLRAETADGGISERVVSIGIGSMSSLLHLDGTSGSTTFTDETGKSWSRGGSPTISTAQSKFGGASLSLNGSNQHIQTANHSSLQVGAGDFTLDTWVRPTSLGIPESDGNIGATLFGKSDTGSNRELAIFLLNSGGSAWDRVAVAIAETASDSGSTMINLPTPVPVNEFSHLRVSRKQGVLHAHLGGQLAGSASNTKVARASTSAVKIGRSFSGTYAFWYPGFIDEWKFVKGAALSGPEDFDVPTGPSDFPQPAPVLAISGSLPPGNSAASYSSTTDVKIHGAGTPFSVAIIDGELPGDWVAAVNGSLVEITGSAVAAGAYTFTIEVEDDDDNTVQLPVTVVVA